MRKQVPKSWFECYVDYTSRDKVREAVEQHNPNKPELFCYSAFFFFFSITVELKAKEEVQMLPTGFCKAFDTAPTTTSFSPNCRWMDEDWLDGCIQQWTGQRLNVPVNTGDKWCPSVQLSLVGLLVPKCFPQNTDSIQKVKKHKNVTKIHLDSLLHLPPTILILKPHRHTTDVKLFSN